MSDEFQDINEQHAQAEQQCDRTEQQVPGLAFAVFITESQSMISHRSGN